MKGLRRSAVPGAALVTLAAVLWGTDGLFRADLAGRVAPATIVFVEHVILVLVTAGTLPAALRAARSAGGQVIAALVVIGVGASAVATALFTAAFRYGDPVTPLLLQKTQPLLVVAAAWLVLRERPRFSYAPYLLLGGLGAWLLAFPDPGRVAVGRAVPAALALGAAALWGGGTVLGRYVAVRSGLSPAQITALRFAFGLVGSAAVVAVTGAAYVPVAGDVPVLALLALVPGLLALRLYYAGLRSTPAMVATVCELAFPLTAAAIGVTFLGGSLTWTQVAGLVVVAGVVLRLAALSRPPVEVAAEDALPAGEPMSGTFGTAR